MKVTNEDHGKTVGIAFEPDAILPWQFHAALRRRESLQPERQLMLAVLEDAVNTFCKCLRDPHPRTLCVETEAWFASNDHEWPFSFVNVCQALDLDVSWVRTKLSGWRTAVERGTYQAAS